MRLKRSALIHYVKPASGSLSSDYFRIGKDIDDMPVDMNGTFETKKNILGETSVSDTGYEPSVSVSPYMADTSDSIYPFLLDLAMNRKSGEDCKAKFLEVLVENTEATKHKAWEEDCYIEIESYGEGIEGLPIRYVIHPAGNRIAGSVTLSDKVPTFSNTAPTSTFSLAD
jgi:hypothetical protein